MAYIWKNNMDYGLFDSHLVVIKYPMDQEIPKQWSKDVNANPEPYIIYFINMYSFLYFSYFQEVC